MSIKRITAKVYPKDESLDDLANRVKDSMNTYGEKHIDFSCLIEKNIEDNYIIIKTLKLEESAN